MGIVNEKDEVIGVSAPGKLMLSGEWSVLEKGNPCIVLAMDKKVIARIRESDKCYIKLKSLGISTNAKIEGTNVITEKEDGKLAFTKHAIHTALEYLKGKGINPKNFELETDSEMKTDSREAEKLGFGSSAAAVVAISGAVLKLHGGEIETEQEKEVLFKLGIIAHYFAQSKIGSGFDVAASTFGGALLYRKFDPQWLEGKLKEKSVFGVVNSKWPWLEHKNIELPRQMRVVVGFTGKSASTKELVTRLKSFREGQKEDYGRIISEIVQITTSLVGALEKQDNKKILHLLERNRNALRELSDKSGAGLETAELEKIALAAKKYGAAGKFSGAGGGDCGIAVCFDKNTEAKIKKEFAAQGITVIPVGISRDGAK